MILGVQNIIQWVLPSILLLGIIPGVPHTPLLGQEAVPSILEVPYLHLDMSLQVLPIIQKVPALNFHQMWLPLEVLSFIVQNLKNCHLKLTRYLDLLRLTTLCLNSEWLLQVSVIQHYCFWNWNARFIISDDDQKSNTNWPIRLLFTSTKSFFEKKNQ